MKKLIALVLALVTVMACLVSCGTTLEKDADGNLDRGAEINMYLSTEVLNFDPQLPLIDDSMLKVMSLMYEGLTRLDSKGKWEEAIMDGYTIADTDRDGYSILIDLKSTKWTDGITVQARDFVYSWKRLLDPNNKGEAGTLLYDIKNARKVNTGDVSIDDLGVSSVDTYTLKVTFESSDVDLDKFFTNLSSLALVPLREDIITRYGDLWSRRATNIVSNGPFALKQMDEGATYRLERSGYYFRNTEENEILDKYVIPYRLITNYSIDEKAADLAAQLEAYNSEKLFYMGELPLAERANYEKDAEVSDMMSTHTYFFNTENKLFEKAEVRRALSMSLDREKIAEILTFADPAVGYVPNGVFDTSYKNSFREEGEDLLATGANVDEAKGLLNSAGVKSGSFSILVRDNEADLAVAEYVVSVWESLGFKVNIEKAGTSKQTIQDGEEKQVYIIDEYNTRYAEGDFDVIALDMVMAAPDAFSALAQFAGDFSGNGIDMTTAEGEIHGHVTGYSSEAYTELIEKAYAAETDEEKATLLHEAEKLLMEDMPVVPLVFLKSAYIKSKVLSGFETTYYGTTDFKRVKMKNYMDYKQVETEAAQ